MRKKMSLFRYAKRLNEKFKTFLMNITEAGIVFGEAVSVYMKKQDNRTFMGLKEKISRLESQNDELRRTIEFDLYRQMILPGMRSDILDLMEGCDHVINQYERIVLLWSVEHPKVPVDFSDEVTALIGVTQECVAALVSGVNSFLDGELNVEEEVQHCYFMEHSADLLALSLKEKIFLKKIPLARQLELKDFIEMLEKISDLAEDAADKLKIISVKHAL
ncbi:MAG: DUF47 family protein [Alphaproteobacteria bacterium]|nr:DUF47 family protein [Alphaproteobacteria bacterium]